MGISEAAMKEIHQKAQDEKQVLMKQAQVRSSTVWCGVVWCDRQYEEEWRGVLDRYFGVHDCYEYAVAIVFN